MSHDQYADGRNINTAEQNWDSGIDFGKQSNTYKLVRALLSEADRIDDNLTEVYHSHHIDTAEGEDLEQFGRLVNSPRKNGEPDDKYRTRIKAEFAQAKTDTDFDSFVEFCATVLGTDISNLEFGTSYDADSATVTVRADSKVFSNVALVGDEVIDIIDGGVPAGHEVKVLERGTFILKEDGDIDDPERGLTSDSVNTGGTLAADIV
jgi:hypothetical protein